MNKLKLQLKKHLFFIWMAARVEPVQRVGEFYKPRNINKSKAKKEMDATSATTAAAAVPRMRNPLAFTAAGSDDMVAGPASMSSERPRLPAQFQVASMMTADTRAPPSHRGRGLGAGADKRYESDRRVTAFQSPESFSFAAAAADKPLVQQQQILQLQKNNEEGMRSSAWIERARADARATKMQYDSEALLSTVVAGMAIAGGALLVVSIVLM
jgi:hypothetical protein